jgi:transposase InsO family protein
LFYRQDGGHDSSGWRGGGTVSSARRKASAGRVVKGQTQLVDRGTWTSRTELASAMFEWIEGWYNPRRRHSALGNLSPVEYEALHNAANLAA